MPLTGTFDILDFSEVLRLVARQVLTGRLHVRSRAYSANLFFEDGHIVGADQSEHQSAACAGDVRGRLEEICFEMLEAERGAFEFHTGKAIPVPGSPRLKVETVISRARTRLQEWHELQAFIPSMDIPPQLVIDLEQTEITIDRERWRLLTAIDGRRTLRAIGRLLNFSDFDTCRVTKDLMEAGIVELDERAAALAFAMGPDSEGPPVTETVTTVNGKQAVKATSPTAAGERTRARIEAAKRDAAARARAAKEEGDDGAGDEEADLDETGEEAADALEGVPTSDDAGGDDDSTGDAEAPGAGAVDDDATGETPLVGSFPSATGGPVPRIVAVAAAERRAALAAPAEGGAFKESVRTITDEGAGDAPAEGGIDDGPGADTAGEDTEARPFDEEGPATVETVIDANSVDVDASTEKGQGRKRPIGNHARPRHLAAKSSAVDAEGGRPRRVVRIRSKLPRRNDDDA